MDIYVHNIFTIKIYQYSVINLWILIICIIDINIFSIYLVIFLFVKNEVCIYLVVLAFLQQVQKDQSSISSSSTPTAGATSSTTGIAAVDRCRTWTGQKNMWFWTNVGEPMRVRSYHTMCQDDWPAGPATTTHLNRLWRCAPPVKLT